MTKFIPKTGSSRCYYICIDVEEFQYKLFQQHAESERDPFPLLRKTGLLYLDRTMFEAIDQRYDRKYKFISGYMFERGCNMTINRVARALWAIRESIQPPILKGVVKRMINTMFGKSIMREKLTWTMSYDLGDIPMFIRKGKLDDVFSIRRRGNKYHVTRFKTMTQQWIRPQFGVNVLSHSRVMMQKYIDTAQTIPAIVFYVNTDCLVMRAGTEFELDDQCDRMLLGDALGRFSYEFEGKARKFICLSNKKYLFCFKDGTFKVRYGPKEGDPEEYFERKYREATEKATWLEHDEPIARFEKR
jgi:hypothetical protein